ncbi:unnamed protein product [Coccothraustes coccothraustes]
MAVRKPGRFSSPAGASLRDAFARSTYALAGGRVLPSLPACGAAPLCDCTEAWEGPAPVRASNSVRVCCVRVCCVRDPHPASPPPADGTNSGACPLLLPGPSAEGSEGASGGHRSPTATHRPGE